MGPGPVGKSLGLGSGGQPEGRSRTCFDLSGDMIYRIPSHGVDMVEFVSSRNLSTEVGEGIVESQNLLMDENDSSLDDPDAELLVPIGGH